MAFDEARFGLINWHTRRYCPKGVRPPYVVRRAYKWTYLYAAVEPTTGESFCLFLPGMDARCLEIFLEQLSKSYPDDHLLIVLDGAPSHRSESIVHPHNISLLMLPPYSPEMDPAERWFQEFRPKLSNRTFESVALLHKRHSPGCLCPIGKTAPSSNVSPDTLGGLRRYKHCDINGPERYK
jgi:transposase